MSEADDFQSEVQKRVEAQARERAIAREVMRQSGHFDRAADRWLYLSAIITFVIGIGMLIYWYGATPSQTQLQIDQTMQGIGGSPATYPPGWVLPVTVLMIALGLVFAVRRGILRRKGR